MSKNFVLATPYTAFNAAGLAGGYAPIVTLTHSLIMLKYVNASTAAVQISYDGVANHDLIPSNRDFVLNFQANNDPQGHVAMIRKGTIISVAGAAGVGFFYVIGYYLTP